MPIEHLLHLLARKGNQLEELYLEKHLSKKREMPLERNPLKSPKNTFLDPYLQDLKHNL